VTRAELEAMAERVEREEPSEELRDAVAVAAGWQKIKQGWNLFAPDIRYREAPRPAFLDSLDAAVTLVPVGYASSININPDGTAIASMYREDLLPVQPVHSRPRMTPAAALTAAALRARAMEARND